MGDSWVDAPARSGATHCGRFAMRALRPLLVLPLWAGPRQAQHVTHGGHDRLLGMVLMMSGAPARHVSPSAAQNHEVPRAAQNHLWTCWPRFGQSLPGGPTRVMRVPLLYRSEAGAATRTPLDRKARQRQELVVHLLASRRTPTAAPTRAALMAAIAIAPRRIGGSGRRSSAMRAET